MYLPGRISKSTGDYLQQIERFKMELQNTDAILVGAGSGLSSSAGFLYTGERFYQNFQDFANKYHFTDMYLSLIHISFNVPRALSVVQ